MARIYFIPDVKSESSGTSGNKYPAAPRGIYTLEITGVSEGETTRGGKNPGTPKTSLICEISDGPHRGTRLWHTVVWIPRGTGEKSAPGHGMAVRFLHAIGLTLDGMKSLDEKVFMGKRFRALLEVETYDKVKDGTTYTNEKNVVAQIYHDDEPEILPAPPVKSSPAIKTSVPVKEEELEEIPF